MRRKNVRTKRVKILGRYYTIVKRGAGMFDYYMLYCRNCKEETPHVQTVEGNKVCKECGLVTRY